MPISDNPQMMRAVIMDHYEYPHNKKLKEDEKYIRIHMDSESCIDDIQIGVLIEKGIIKDVCFDGIACTISTASTDIMSDLMKEKTLEEAQNIINQYLAMIHEKPYNDEILEEAVVFKNTSKQANRIKCATIGWHGMQKALDEYQKKDL